MLLLIWILNAVISWLNAWGCGKTWNESKANGGMPHFLNWCGAVMSAAGFTWCYLVLVGFAGATIPLEHVVNGHKVVEPYLNAADIQAFAQLGYLVIIGPILGSGIAITLHSWGVMWRERMFGSTAVSAWNTFAMGKNIYDAASSVPEAVSGVGRYFSSSKSNDKNVGIVVLVAASALLGCLTTYWILNATRKATASERRFAYAAREL